MNLAAGQPCLHPGCLHHVSHPCEGCGRTAGRYPPLRPLGRALRDWRRIGVLKQELLYCEMMTMPVVLKITEDGELQSFRRAPLDTRDLDSARGYLAGIILRENGGEEMIVNGTVDPGKLAKKLHALAAVVRKSEITPLWVAAVLADAGALVERRAYPLAAEELEKIASEVKVELPPTIQIGLHDLEDEVLLLAVHGEDELKKLTTEGKS